MRVRDELNGDEWDAAEVLWSSALPRDAAQSWGRVRNYGWKCKMTDSHAAWAKPSDPLDDCWRPVEVLP